MVVFNIAIIAVQDRESNKSMLSCDSSEIQSSGSGWVTPHPATICYLHGQVAYMQQVQYMTLSGTACIKVYMVHYETNIVCI